MSTMNTGDVTRRLGMTVTTSQLLELGFKPVGQDKRATLFAQSDYPAICEALADWIKGRAGVPMQPKPERHPPAGKPKSSAAASAGTKADDDDEL
jgi:hypothetical protein